jgi:serine/threonine protein kinase
MTAEPIPPQSSLPLPRRFGQYVLFDFIGRGGMAEIYLARVKTDLGASRLCVVKEILPGLALHQKFADMLIHEAKLAARLSHANVVQVFELGRADDRLFIAMDYIEGFDLNDLLRRCSRSKVPLPFEFAVRIVSDTLKGLDYAHRRVDDDGKPLGIVHRDVSPSNILISLEGEVKLCDFGIAHAIGAALSPEDSNAMVDEAIKGKAGYMSPEHARGEKIDARADVFAAGIVLWELVAGRRMYKADTGKPPLLEQARNAEVPELPARDFPREETLRKIVGKALAVNRDERYPTAQAMQRDLEHYMADAKMVASPLKLGEWLVDKFGTDIVTQRRARERAVLALERGAPVSYGTLPAMPKPLPSMPPPRPTPRPPPAVSAMASPSSASSLSPVPLAPRTPSPPVAFVPLTGQGAAAIDHAPSSMAGASLDVSPPSSLIAYTGPTLPTPRMSSRKRYVVIAALIIVIALLALALLVLRRA